MSVPKKSYLDTPDSAQVTDAQKMKLCEMVGAALTEIRALGWDGKHDQATALADVFHNVPAVMWTPFFSLGHLQQQLERYQKAFPGNAYVDYSRYLAEVKSAAQA